MVATNRPPREIVDVDKPSRTEQLANWISRVRCKKLMCRRNRKRDLRVEAVLTHALCRAEHELRDKQMSRITRWQQLKKQFLKDLEYPHCDFYGENVNGKRNAGDEQAEMRKHPQEPNIWEGPLCPELSSLDNFMSRLGEIKAPLQR